MNRINQRLWQNMIKKNPDKPWNWYRISNNPNITMDMIEKNPDKHWSWSDISGNTMNFNSTFIVIHRWYRSIKFQNFVKRASLNYRLKMEIEYLPVIGVEYIQIMEEAVRNGFNR